MSTKEEVSHKTTIVKYHEAGIPKESFEIIRGHRLIIEIRIYCGAGLTTEEKDEVLEYIHSKMTRGTGKFNE